MTAPKLPELPEPDYVRIRRDGYGDTYYTADQMESYARAAVEAAQTKDEAISDRSWDIVARRGGKVPLSHRIRPECEAAPWVVEEVRKLEVELAAAVAAVGASQQEVERLKAELARQNAAGFAWGAHMVHGDKDSVADEGAAFTQPKTEAVEDEVSDGCHVDEGQHEAFMAQTEELELRSYREVLHPIKAEAVEGQDHVCDADCDPDGDLTRALAESGGDQ